MTAMNLKPAFKYCGKNMLSGVFIFLAIMLVITVAVAIRALNIVIVSVSEGNETTIMFTAFEMAAAIAALVTGIVSVRENMRLLVQNGVGRRTAFIAEILVTIVMAALMSLAGLLITDLGQAIASADEHIFIGTLYSLFYQERAATLIPAVMYLETIIWSFIIYLTSCMTGMFISLMFYRLNKMWTVIVAIGVPVFFTIVLPVILMKSAQAFAVHRFPIAAFENPWTVILTGFCCSVFLGAVCWLLIRKAPIKPAAK